MIPHHSALVFPPRSDKAVYILLHLPTAAKQPSITNTEMETKQKRNLLDHTQWPVMWGSNIRNESRVMQALSLQTTFKGFFSPVTDEPCWKSGLPCSNAAKYAGWAPLHEHQKQQEDERLWCLLRQTLLPHSLLYDKCQFRAGNPSSSLGVTCWCSGQTMAQFVHHKAATIYSK